MFFTATKTIYYVQVLVLFFLFTPWSVCSAFADPTVGLEPRCHHFHLPGGGNPVAGLLGSARKIRNLAIPGLLGWGWDRTSSNPCWFGQLARLMQFAHLCWSEGGGGG